MKKWIIILAIIAIIGVVFFALPMNVKVERTVEINASKESVYENVSKFENFVKWSPWSGMDPSQKYEITGEDGQVGAKYTWSSESEHVGSGFQEITKASESRVDIHLEFTAPWQSQSSVYYEFSGEEGVVEVKWGYEGEGNLITKLMVEGMLGDNYDQGLADLKKLCEK